MQIYLNDNVIVINNRFENKLYLYDRIRKIEFEINEDTFDILEDIKENQYDINDLKKKYDGNFIDQLQDLQIITTNVQKNINNVKRIVKNNNIRIFAEITDKCNLRCKHCYGGFECENSTQLSIEKLKKLIDNASENNVYQFDLTGGEPFLYPHIEELLSYLFNSGMLVRIFTNLTIFGKKQSEMISKYGVKNIVTSLDSSRIEVHEKFRGQIACFDKTINAIKKLQENEVDVTINTMIGDHNKDHIEELVEFIKNTKARSVLDVIVPEGRAVELNENILDSANLIKCIYKKNFDIIDPNAIAINCGVGNSFIYIKSDGNIYICPSLISKEFKLGNIDNFDTNLYWNNMKEKFDNLRCSKYSKRCGSCKGGCRARALRINGNILEKDDIYCIINEVGCK